MTRRKLAAGNWKMNGLVTSLVELDALMAGVGEPNCDVLICPPASLLSRAADAASGTSIAIGGQDCHASSLGAHTGDISAEMLKNAGASAFGTFSARAAKQFSFGEREPLRKIGGMADVN